MSLTITCVRCGQPIAVDPAWGGRVVACPRCTQSLIVPVVQPTFSQPPGLKLASESPQVVTTGAAAKKPVMRTSTRLTWADFRALSGKSVAWGIALGILGTALLSLVVLIAVSAAIGASSGAMTGNAAAAFLVLAGISGVVLGPMLGLVVAARIAKNRKQRLPGTRETTEAPLVSEKNRKKRRRRIIFLSVAAFVIVAPPALFVALKTSGAKIVAVDRRPLPPGKTPLDELTLTITTRPGGVNSLSFHRVVAGNIVVDKSTIAPVVYVGQAGIFCDTITLKFHVPRHAKDVTFEPHLFLSFRERSIPLGKEL